MHRPVGRRPTPFPERLTDDAVWIHCKAHRNQPLSRPSWRWIARICSPSGIRKPSAAALDQAPAEFQSVVREMRETRAGQFVLRLYREERYRARP